MLLRRQPGRRLRPSRWSLELGLVAVTAVWGWTFVVVKEGIELVPPLSFNAARFGLAAVALGLWGAPRLRRLGAEGWRHGVVLGVFLWAGYAFQTFGLASTPASTAGFITGLFVVFTPLLAAAALRVRPTAAALAGVVLAVVGLGLLSLDSSLRLGLGELLVLGCAVSFAAHIVGLGAWSHRHDALALTVVQLVVAALLHTLGAAATEVGRSSYTWDASVVVAIALTALLASAAAFWIQTAAQRVIPPTRAAVVLTMEPVFAGLFGFVLLGERLPLRGWFGAALILAAMLVTELSTAGTDRRSSSEKIPA